MARKSPSKKRHRHKDDKGATHRFSLLRELRNYFFTGVVVVMPVAVTAWLVFAVVTFVDGQVKPLVPPAYNPDNYLPFAVPGFGLLVVVFFLTALGALAANIVGRSLLGFGESVVERVPLVRNVYGALKQLVETVVQQRETSFQEVVLIEYPRRGLYAVGFVTANARGEVGEALGDNVVGVFVPTTPNPTSGFLLFVPRDDITPLSMTVEEGAKLIISAGLVTPDGPITPDQIRLPLDANAAPDAAADPKT